MSVVDAIFPSDASALYDAVAKGDCVKLVLAYAKAVRHAFSVISSRRNISDRSGECSCYMYFIGLSLWKS